MKNKLVTLIGGGGFAGRYIAQDLLKAGARVRIAERDPRDAWFIRPLGGLGQTQFVGADMTKPDTIARAVAGSDAVVNLVGAFKGNLDALHVEGPRRMAQAAAAHGVEALVQISAIGADVESPSRYGRTKGEGEAAIRGAFPAATILRPSILFGREDRFVNRFADMITKVSAMPLVHIMPLLGARTKFQPLFVGDLAAAVTNALRATGAHAGKTLELGGPDILTMRELIDWIAKAIDCNPTIAELPGFAGNLISSFGFLPGAPITRDQWLMLQHDTVAAHDDLRALGVTPTPLGAVAPGWLNRYRRNGRFAQATA